MNVVRLKDIRASRDQSDSGNESERAVINIEQPVNLSDHDTEIKTERFETAQPLSPLIDVPIKIARMAYIMARALVVTAFVSVRTVCRYLYRHPVHAILNLLFVLVLSILLSTGAELHKQLILSKISSETVDKIIAGSRFTRDFDAEAINGGGVRELLRVGAPIWTQREAVRAILYHARKAGLGIEDQAVLLAIADIESGFNPMARAATTTACGLFQFIRRTGESFSLSTGECMDPWLNAESGIKHYVYNFERRVRAKVDTLNGAERVFRTFELSYYLHHDGSDYTAPPSNEVKATILNGTQFLFAAYHELQNEAESQRHVPAFSESLSAKVWRSLDDVSSMFENFNILGLGSVQARSGEASEQGTASKPG